MALITSQAKPFMQLVDLQQKSLDTLTKIKDSVQQTAAERAANTQVLQLEAVRKLVATQQESLKITKRFSNEQNKQMADMLKSTKSWKTMGDKLGDIKRSLAEGADPASIKRKLLSAMNIGGMANKKIDEMDYIKRQKALGSTRSAKDLRGDFKEMGSAARGAGKANEELDRLRGMGMTDQQIGQTKKGKELFDTRKQNLDKYNKLNIGLGVGAAGPGSVGVGKFSGDEPSAPLAQLASDKGKVSQSTTDVLAEQQQQKEIQLENLKYVQEQNDLLKQIAANTSALKGGNNSAAGGAEDAGKTGADSGRGMGGLGKGIGAGISGLGKGLGSFAQSVGRGAGNGIAGLLQGIASGLAAIANPATLLGLGAATLAIMGIGKALEMAAPGLQALAPVMMKVAEVIGETFMKAISMIPDVINSIGSAVTGVITAISDGIVNTIDAMVSAVERLSSLDGKGLLDVGAGLMAVSAGLIAFGAANVTGGLANLVSGFLNFISGGKSPIDQLEQISKMGDNLQKAGTGITSLAGGMVSMSKIDKDSMEAVKQFPWDDVRKFVDAGGAIQLTGAKIYNSSKTVEDEKSNLAGKSKGGTSSNVQATVQNNSTTTTVSPPRARTQESSYQRYMDYQLAP